jgi:Protein of unknown function (DUF3305)
LRSTALARIPVGVIVERRKAKSPWIDYLWRPASVLVGTPSAAPWTALNENPEAILFYAGTAMIELHRTETTYYRDNLASGAPSLWVALRSAGAEPPYGILTVTADPAEGEALTDAGDNVVEAVPMPAEIIESIRRFLADHHVERPFVKRRRIPAEPAPCRPGERPEDDG